MAQGQYDAIVVGARCAGSPTAMLLARKGYRVLVVDRATFPSDTLSTHVLHPPGAAALKTWGLLDRLTATGCPPIDTYAFDFGPFTIEGAPGTDDSPVAYCPRRTVLDKLLATPLTTPRGAPEFTVEDVIVERPCRVFAATPRTARPLPNAKVVISRTAVLRVAEAVGGAVQRETRILCGYYTYWSDLPIDGRFEVYVRPGRMAARLRATASRCGWRLAVRGTRSQPARRRRELPEDVDLAPESASAAAPSVRRASQVLPYRTSSANRTGLGALVETPATTRTS
jgi:hypothetical protein